MAGPFSSSIALVRVRDTSNPLSPALGYQRKHLSSVISRSARPSPLRSIALRLGSVVSIFGKVVKALNPSHSPLSLSLKKPRGSSSRTKYLTPFPSSSCMEGPAANDGLGAILTAPENSPPPRLDL